jgi:ABC-2 type transport system ATP-binding protein
MIVGEHTVIRAQGLVKHYRVTEHRQGRFAALRDLLAPQTRTVEALKGVDLHIGPGEMVGIIGRNGAGKSTLIKLLTGVLVPTAGTVDVLDLVPSRNRRRLAYHVGVMFGQRTQLWWDLPVLDSLRLHQTMYGIPEARFQQNLRLFDELLELGQLLNKAVRQLSLGQRTRADLALCLLHDPRVLFLDEPTIGLDVLVKDRIRTFLRRLNQERGTTVLLTSHDVADVEEVCRRVLIIDAGAILFDGSLEAVKRRYIRERLVKVTLAEPVPWPAWDDWGGVRLVQSDGLVHTLAFAPEETPVQQVLGRIVTTLPVADVSLEEPGIGSVVRQLQLGEMGATGTVELAGEAQPAGPTAG